MVMRAHDPILEQEDMERDPSGVCAFKECDTNSKDNFICTRPQGHRGVHAAGVGDGYYIVLEEEGWMR